MKTKAFMMCLSMSFAGLAISCTSESEEPGLASGKGMFALDLTSGVVFETETRAVNESSYRLADNYTVVITNQSGTIEKFNGTYSTLKNRLPMEMENGTYKVQAYMGSSQAASQNAFRSEVSRTFTIQSQPESSPLEVLLKPEPTCGKVFVNFVKDGEDGLDKYYEDYYVTIEGTKALGESYVTWAKNETDPWYLQLNDSETGEDVKYTIHLISKADYATQLADGSKTTNSEISGTFNLKRNKATKLTISANYTPTTEGGLKIVITIDDTTNPEKVIPIPVPTSWK